MRAFNWQDGQTVQLAATTGGARVAFKQPLGGLAQIRVWNPGTEVVFITRGDAAVTATLAGGLPIPPGVLEVLTVNDVSTVTHIAGITATGPVTLYVTPGQGV